MKIQGLRIFTNIISSAFVVLLTIISFHFTQRAYAQSDNLRFENISTEQGLSQSTVTAILQDRQGFMWFGTEGGLNKFDGYQFYVYKHDENDPLSLSDNVITSIYEDRNGDLWVGSFKGLDRLDKTTGTFIHYTQMLTGEENPGEIIVSVITQDQSGTLWIGTDEKGLISLDLKTNRSTVYEHNSDDLTTLSNNTIDTVYEDRDGILWIGTSMGLDRFERSTGTFTHGFQDSSELDILDNVSILALHEDSTGALWIGTKEGLFQWDRGSDVILEYRHDPNNLGSLSDDSVRCIFSDSQGKLWIGTRNGLDRYDAEQKRFIHYIHNLNDPQSLISDSIRTVYEDRSGVIWIGTAGGGISKYAWATHKFDLYKYNPGQMNSLSDNNVWSIYEDSSDNLWIGTFSAGINKLDRISGRATVYQSDPGESNQLSDNAIRAILEDRSGNVWVGTEFGGLNRFDPETEIFYHYQNDPADPGSLSSDNVFDIYEDHLGRLWIGTQGGGLNLLDPATGSFTHYQHDPSDPFSISNNNLRVIYEDHTDILWIGTLGGVNLFDGQTNRFTLYRHDPQNPQSLSTDFVASIFEDAQGTIWIGTFGGGLNRFDRATQTFSHYTEKDGLPDNTVYGILSDSEGYLWLSTNQGLAKFNPNEGTFRNYDISDGLQGNQFNPGAFFQSKNGEMFFGGTQGLNTFFPELVTDNPVPPPLVITAFKKFNQTIDLSADEPIQLSFQDNFISFEFAALDFNAPEKNQYAYQLEGIDKDWVFAGTRRYVSYTNLPGGKYVFRVKGSNNDGIWNESGITIPIKITPPFWQTGWFISICFVLFSVSLVVGFQWRVRTVKENARRLEDLVEQKTSELRETNEQLEIEVENRTRAEEELARRAADELRHSEARFEAIFENAAIGIGIMGFDRQLMDANPALCCMFGRSLDELIGQTPVLVTYAEDYPQTTQEFQGFVSGEKDYYESERRYVRKNGETFWAHVTMNIVRDAENNPLYIVAMVLDIDNQKRIQLELLRSEERFRATFESSAIGMGLLAPDGKILEVNDAVCKMSGYTVEELRQRYDHQNVYPEDLHVGDEFSAELFAGHRDSYELEKRYVRKNGEVFWARQTISAVRNPDNTVAYLVGMIEDIDAQIKMWSDLQASEARFRAIFENVAVGVAIMSLDRRALAINPVAETIIGYKLEELENINPVLLAVSEDRSIDTELFQELIQGTRDSYVMERRYRRKDGRVIWARINYSLVRDPKGHPSYLVGMIEDIDDQKRSAERLAAQEAEYRLTLENRVAERTRELTQINQRLEEEITQRKKAEQALAEKAAQDAIVNERTRLARDLHDAVTQTLFSSSLIAEVIPDLWMIDPAEGQRRLEELRQMTRGALAEMRTLLVELRPNSLVQIPLPDLLRQLCESLIGRARLPIQFTAEGQAKIPPDVQIALYRITQEALNNIVKHAKATRVIVSLQMGEVVRLMIVDDGSGFDLAAVSPENLGLKIMCERAESIGTHCSIYSQPGEGTQISIIWPTTGEKVKG